MVAMVDHVFRVGGGGTSTETNRKACCCCFRHQCQARIRETENIVTEPGNASNQRSFAKILATGESEKYDSQGIILERTE